MTLGRTSSGSIKIKTDGGLRAVECACCGGCGCGVLIPQNLREKFANPSNITMYGKPADEFYLQGQGLFAPDATWTAIWLQEDSDPRWEAGIAYYENQGCLISSFYYIQWYFGEDLGTEGIALLGPVSECGLEDSEQDVDVDVEGTFTINGEGEYPYTYFIGDDGFLTYVQVPPPNITIE